MKWFLYLVSIAWVALGVYTILYTEPARRFVRRVRSRTILALFPFIAGILLLLGASFSHYPWLVRFIGLVAAAKGVFIFMNPKHMFDGIYDWYLNAASDQTYRFSGIILIILGTAVLSWVY